ncbi:MAG: ergothioneine biosynthesis glutamate--cysteine ligase EgtA [Hamadaea sp.]|nr:ergothioneine biosynthesis glutamate--cysteine ligase EgtA [Hamadaea sp.]
MTDRPITEAEAESFVAERAIEPSSPAQLGVELEYLLADVGDPAATVDPAYAQRVLTDAGALPRTSALTWEPGGALELSSRPGDRVGDVLTDVAADLAAARKALWDKGIRLIGAGLDPLRPPRRILEAPRYVAMEAHFDRRGEPGRWMMTRTASVQVCLHAGADRPGWAGYRGRWRLAHDLGPVLIAAFANSPVARGHATGWCSTRQAVWSRLDAGRTTPVGGDDPREAWARYALDADVLCVRVDDGPWTAPAGLTFREWIRAGRPRPPTAGDLAYHLTTLFPPVRPRGYLELRMIDAQAGGQWTVPFAVAAALLTDDRAADAAAEACEPLRTLPHLWQEAARRGLKHPALARAAQRCFDAALDALPVLGVDAQITRRVAWFAETFTARGRCPADDVLLATTRLRPHRTADADAVLGTVVAV